MPIWAPKRSGLVLGADGKDARAHKPPPTPEWWVDFRKEEAQDAVISGQKFRIAQVGTNGLQLVFRGSDPGWQTKVSLNTLHMLNGHWFVVSKKVDQGILMDYRHPGGKKRKGK